MGTQLVADGLSVIHWREFAELCAKAGVPLNPEGRTILYLSCDVKDDVALYHSEEFKAFCKRAGIRHELPTIRITIMVKDGEMPVVHHTYAMISTDPFWKEGDPELPKNMHPVVRPDQPIVVKK